MKKDVLQLKQHGDQFSIFYQNYDVLKRGEFNWTASNRIRIESYQCPDFKTRLWICGENIEEDHVLFSIPIQFQKDVYKAVAELNEKFGVEGDSEKKEDCDSENELDKLVKRKEFVVIQAEKALKVVRQNYSHAELELSAAKAARKAWKDVVK